MRPVVRPLLRLALATILMLSLQYLYEEISFPSRFHWPIRWYAPGLSGRGGVVMTGTSGTPFAWVRGQIQQPVELLGLAGPHGLRPITIHFRYQAPSGGAWVGLAGDLTDRPVAELTLETSPALSIPRLPDKRGLYRVNLPRTDRWSTIALKVTEHTDLPYLTMSLGGPWSGEPARFGDVTMTYADQPAEELLYNGDFRESWPTWAVHPEWANPLYGVGQTREGRVFAWPPALTTVLILCLASIMLGFSLSRNRHHAPAVLLGVAWVSLSALLILGSQWLPDLPVILFPSPSVPRLVSLLGILAWALQLSLFAFIGWVGFQTLGLKARFWMPSILVIAALMMGSSVGMGIHDGLPRPIVNPGHILEDTGPLWLIAGAAMVWFGIVRAAAHAAPEGNARVSADQ